MTYKVQIDDTVREATADETAAIEAAHLAVAAQQQAEIEAATTRNSALAKLKALGLTDAEVATLVGA